MNLTSLLGKDKRYSSFILSIYLYCKFFYVQMFLVSSAITNFWLGKLVLSWWHCFIKKIIVKYDDFLCLFAKWTISLPHHSNALLSCTRLSSCMFLKIHPVLIAGSSISLELLEPLKKRSWCNWYRLVQING